VFGMMSKGTVAEIWARCLTFNDGENRLVIVTYDLNCLDVATPILRERCANELGIPAGQLLLLATHNHNAPIQIVPDNFDYGRWLADTLLQLIRDALRNESGPVTVEFASTHGEFVWAVGNAPADTGDSSAVGPRTQ
jgi:neutral ceramidase